MPLIKLQRTGDQGAWALWYISENEQELANHLQEKPESTIIHSNKRLEWLAGRMLLQQLTKELGYPYQGTMKDEFGKPFLKNLPHHISLSHSFPYVAAQIDLLHEIGIDLEQPKAKLLTIAHRILAPAELEDAGTNIIKHCVYWCAKEAMYKIYGKKGLFFLDQLNIEPFTLENTGNLNGKIKAKDIIRLQTMTYIIQPDYVLVLTKTPSL
jgi:phosphopantetheinyl transferase